MIVMLKAMSDFFISDYYQATQRLALQAAGAETGSKTETCQSSEQTQKNAPSPSRPVHLRRTKTVLFPERNWGAIGVYCEVADT